jgi:MFS family permease
LLTKLANGVGSSATYYGIVAAASSLGMALAMPFLTRLKRRRTAPGVVIGCIVALAVGSLLVGLLGAIGVSGVSGVILLAVAITTAFVGSYSAADKLLAVVQVTASATERAVAIATVSIVAMAAETVANLVEGVLADAIPVWWIQVVAGLLAAILATVGVVAKRRGWLPSEPAPAT